MVKVKYTITTILEHELSEFGANTKTDLIKQIREYIKDDPGYILESLDKAEIKAELIEE